ncbi:Cthe_2314 family HEPN domain-containing protein [Cohnella faecalis]|uniref:Cthe-2314-like HEPN domain-containing protein n=1 Tax=Cohnella faecalis TaxID=2315694 RepID=A0A398CPV0_9BACL|nr:Cthe_2314 family HEPN domain-containing protein [Cohnella faecalis]RIE02768.1 hypothetical protein D3H35_19200 [Cohnella faecalis]
MLRILLGEQPSEWDEHTRETVQAIESFILLAGNYAKRRSEKAANFRKFAVRAEGVLRSLDELEQSKYVALRYAERIEHSRLTEMSPDEKLDYDRHVYFDKNAYIRVFSLLDKLGALLNDFLELNTSRMKPQFSYFTVLRNMRLNGLHSELFPKLDEIKEKFREPMSRLRKRRNMEIHFMNAELQDDIVAVGEKASDRSHLENIHANMADLDCGWAMVSDSLRLSLQYSCRRLRAMS